MRRTLSGYDLLWMKGTLHAFFYLVLLCTLSHRVYSSPAPYYLHTESSRYLWLLHTVTHSQIRSFQLGGCGNSPREKLQALVTFNNDLRFCAKIHKSLRESRGALYFYHLTRIWGDVATTPVKLTTIDNRSPVWESILDDLQQVNWLHGTVVALTPYYENLETIKLPEVLQGKDSVTINLMASSQDLGQIEYEQWSDLIVMDYLAGESDRLSFLLVNKQWNDNIFKKPIHNLFQKDRQLFLLDNDRTFGVGYFQARSQRYLFDFQQHFINLLCYFNAVTLNDLRALGLTEHPVLEIEHAIAEYDTGSLALAGRLPKLDGDEFKERLRYVLKRAADCGY